MTLDQALTVITTVFGAVLFLAWSTVTIELLMCMFEESADFHEYIAAHSLFGIWMFFTWLTPFLCVQIAGFRAVAVVTMAGVVLVTLLFVLTRENVMKAIGIAVLVLAIVAVNLVLAVNIIMGNLPLSTLYILPASLISMSMLIGTLRQQRVWTYA